MDKLINKPKQIAVAHIDRRAATIPEKGLASEDPKGGLTDIEAVSSGVGGRILHFDDLLGCMRCSTLRLHNNSRLRVQYGDYGP